MPDACSKKWREANKEKLKAQKAAWYQANKKRIAKQRKAYYRKNKIKIMDKVLKWRQENKEHYQEWRKQYRNKNKKRISTYYKKYRKENIESLREQNRKYKQEKTETRRAERAAYYEANKERIDAERKNRKEAIRKRRIEESRLYYKKNKKRFKDYRKNNRENLNLLERKRRAMKALSVVPLTEEEQNILKTLENVRISLQKKNKKKYHIDHIIPLVYGGLHHPCNLRIVEASINVSKRDKILPEGIALVHEHYKLYNERVGLERAQQFLQQFQQGVVSQKLETLLNENGEKNNGTLQDHLC